MSVEVEFRKWPKTKHYDDGGIMCLITEKLDGTNSLIVVTDSGEVKAGSRNQFITPEKDNFGFAAWVESKKDDLIKLGPGYHYGEWIGNGIQRNYGLGHRALYLFNPGRYMENEEMPDCVNFVPMLGACDIRALNYKIQELETDLKQNGSRINRFNSPEGLIIDAPAIGYRRKIIWE